MLTVWLFKQLTGTTDAEGREEHPKAEQRSLKATATALFPKSQQLQLIRGLLSPGTSPAFVQNKLCSEAAYFSDARST